MTPPSTDSIDGETGAGAELQAILAKRRALSDTSKSVFVKEGKASTADAKYEDGSASRPRIVSREKKEEPLGTILDKRREVSEGEGEVFTKEGQGHTAAVVYQYQKYDANPNKLKLPSSVEALEGTLRSRCEQLIREVAVKKNLGGGEQL